jgi:hypothetical protein
VRAPRERDQTSCHFRVRHRAPAGLAEAHEDFERLSLVVSLIVTNITPRGVAFVNVVSARYLNDAISVSVFVSFAISGIDRTLSRDAAIALSLASRARLDAREFGAARSARNSDATSV